MLGHHITSGTESGLYDGHTSGTVSRGATCCDIISPLARSRGYVIGTKILMFPIKSITCEIFFTLSAFLAEKGFCC